MTGRRPDDGRRRASPRRLDHRRAHAGTGRPLPTGRGTLVLLLGTALYGAGANVSSGWTLLVAAACLGAVGHALAVVWGAGRAVTATRELPSLATGGRAVPVAVRVAGAGSRSVLVVDPATGLVGVLDRGEDVLRADVVLRRGRVGEAPVVLRCTDRLGLVSAWLRRDDDARALVLPAPDPRPLAAVLAADDGEAHDGGRPSHRRAQGPDLVGLRDHEVGDPLAAVHWRASARRGELVSRDTRAPRQPRRELALVAGTWTTEQLDLACAVVVGQAERDTLDGRPVTVAADGVRLPWGAGAAAHLATLPPAAGVAPRPLAATGPPTDVGVERVALAPAPDGRAVVVGDHDVRTATAGVGAAS